MTGSPADEFGYSVALSGDGKRLAIGSPGQTTNTAVDKGRIVVLRWNLLKMPFPGATIGQTLDGENAGDRLGTAVAFSSDGKVIAGGAPTTTVGGYVKVFKVEGDENCPPTGPLNCAANGWKQVTNLNFFQTVNGAFGSAVGLSADGKSLIIGAPKADKGREVAGGGGFSVYELNAAGVYSLKGDWTYGLSGYQMGTSVGMCAQGKDVVVGSPGAASSMGLASTYEFKPSGVDPTPSPIPFPTPPPRRLCPARSAAGRGRSSATGSPRGTASGRGRASGASLRRRMGASARSTRRERRATACMPACGPAARSGARAATRRRRLTPTTVGRRSAPGSSAPAAVVGAAGRPPGPLPGPRRR